MTYSMVSILIILVTAFILLKFEGKIKEVYAEAIEKQTCKTSVKAHALLKLKYADFSGEINCPTIYLKINDKKEDITKKKIADAMYDCWDQYGKGELELFSDDSVYCAICHRLTFDKEIKINEFTKYLATKQAPGGKVTYLQFLNTKKTQNTDSIMELENKKVADSIDASKNNEYAVIFTYIKGRQNWEYYTEKSKYYLPAGGTIALSFGSAYLAYTSTSFIIASLVAAPAAPLLLIGGGIATLGYFYNVPFEHIALISFIPYDAQSLQNLNCKEIPTKQQ